MKTFFRHYTQDLGFNPQALPADFYNVWFNAFKLPDYSETLSRFVYSSPLLFCGHHIMESDEFPLLSGADRYVPVSPLFARDLAGRVIYLGTGPEQKSGADWPMVDIADTTGLDEFDLELSLSAITFPKGCRSTLGMEGVDELETVFLTRFRNLEIGMAPGVPASGGTDNEIGVYERANLYPYKLRPDTFYIDGYKLPQTMMLFARGEDEGVSPAAAQKLGEGVLNQWRHRDQSWNWEKFCEKMGGEAWIEGLFAKGCTIIPTFEAHNGYNVVSRDFELTDYWPGRAVLGLHSVVESKPSKAPVGTILEVLDPGFITAGLIFPARVVISDGSGFVSAHGDDPLPMLPNLHLPHQRAVSQWGGTWLPTHPGHFELPALWGYDALDTGRFVQISGPLWDPLHYFYASTDVIITAHINQPGELVPVPEAMHNRFFPITLCDGFDTFDAAELARRTRDNIYPRTAIVRHPTGKPGFNLGYHPLPLEYEYELEPFWAPECHPLNRGHGVCPDDLLPRVAPVVIPPIGSEVYLNSLQVPDAAPWFKAPELLTEASIDPVACYPQLARYIMPDASPEQWLPLFPAPFVAQPRRELLTASVQELWEGMDAPEELQAIAPGLYDAIEDAKEEAATFMRYRHYLYRGKKLLYMLGWWYGLTVDELTMLDEQGDSAEAAQKSEAAQQGNARMAAAARAVAQGPAEPQRRRTAAQPSGIPVVRE